MTKNKLSEAELKKIEELFDNQSETQDDVLLSYPKYLLRLLFFLNTFVN